jgi:site-specific recombinase XerD
VEPVGEWSRLVVLPPPAGSAVVEADTIDLSADDLARVWAAVDASTSANTKAAYRSDWARFQSWTAEAGYPCLPAPDMVVAAYLTDAAAALRPDGRAQFSPATLSRWVSSINQIHTAAGLLAPGRSEVVRRTLSGVRRMRRSAPKRRSPLLLADVRTILTAMSPSLWVWPDAVAAHRDAALLLMGFAGAHRRSELVALRVQDVAVHPADGLHIQMVSSKTDQEGRGAVRALPFGRDPATCPPCALIRWRRVLLAFDEGGRRAALNQVHRRGSTAEHCCRTVDDAAADAQPAGGGGQTGEPGLVGKRWLFPPVHKTGRPGSGAMSGDAVAAMIQRRAAAAGYTPAQVDLLGGHSLRSGFVTEAFRAGADAHSIMRQTGHRDPKMLEVYAREHAPLVGNAVTRLDL